RGSPTAAPCVKIHTRHPECRRDQSCRRFAIGAKSFAIEIQFSVEFSWSPTRQYFFNRRLIDLQKISEPTQIRCQRNNRADIQIAIGPAIQSMAYARREGIVDGGMAYRTTEPHRFETPVLIERALHTEHRIEFDQGQRSCRIVEIDLTFLDLVYEIRRQGIHVNFQAYAQCGFWTYTWTNATEFFALDRAMQF